MSLATGDRRGVAEPVMRFTWPASYLANPLHRCGVVECRDPRLDFRRFCARHAHLWDALALGGISKVLRFPDGARLDEMPGRRGL
jgi:hypothetical protein